MRAVELGDERLDEWDDFAARQPSFALLQSVAWARFKEHLGWKCHRVAVEDQGEIAAGAQVLINPLVPGLAGIAYVPRGPIGRWLDDEVMPLLLAGIHAVTRRSHCVFLRIEPPLLRDAAPAEALASRGFCPSPTSNQPRATLVLDLSPDLDDILKEMRHKTRQYIAAAGREGVTVRHGALDDLPAFEELMRRSAAREDFAPRRPAYYEAEYQALASAGNMILLMAYLGDKLLAVRTACAFGAHAAEFHAGAERDPHVHPNYALVWEAIRWAKARGCVTYDLWGIPDEVGDTLVAGQEPPVPERTDGMWGVYRFKRGFSKRVVAYAGGFDYPYVPRLYTLVGGHLGAGKLDRAVSWLDIVRRGDPRARA